MLIAKDICRQARIKKVVHPEVLDRSGKHPGSHLRYVPLKFPDHFVRRIQVPFYDINNGAADDDSISPGC